MRNLNLLFSYTPLFLIAVLLLSGCVSDEKAGEPSGTATGTSKPKIALIMKSLGNEFFKTMEDGAKSHQAGHTDQYDLLANGIPDEQSVPQQIALVEQMIAQNVQAIVIAPADSLALIDVCKTAQQQGIVVINIDNKFDEEGLKKAGVKIPFVGPNNRTGAKQVGLELAKKLTAGDEVAILEGIPTAFNAQQRRAGFEDATAEAKLKVVATQSAQWETQKAHAITEGLLLAHPNLKAILCSNDSMALGAIAAVEEANQKGKVLIAGFDNISAVQSAMKADSITVTADQHADQLAVFGIEYALESLSKKSELADRETPVDLVTKETLK